MRNSGRRWTDRKSEKSKRTNEVQAKLAFALAIINKNVSEIPATSHARPASHSAFDTEGGGEGEDGKERQQHRQIKIEIKLHDKRLFSAILPRTPNVNMAGKSARQANGKLNELKTNAPKKDKDEEKKKCATKKTIIIKIIIIKMYE